MRLLKVHSLAFEEFADERETPKYGILSHRWESQEVSYQDMLAGVATKKKGFVKIKDFCKHCALDGLSHCWIDTCCIDKGSSAELSEAINSMYRWYQNATKCYAFLCDVNLENSWPLAESEWFKRGWTLQELIAPNHVEFYDSDWTAMGTKRQMVEDVSDVTKIPVDVLLGEHPSAYSIAQRMSWAAHRETTRLEDQAYSLMGLFEVNMPMLYGEGEKAFTRLQEEIIKSSGDHSIFAWPGILTEYDKAEMYDVIHEHQGGLLAKSPFAFALCGNITSPQTSETQQPFAMTNMGLSIDLPLSPCSIDTYQAKLNCYTGLPYGLDPDSSGYISIYLRQTDKDGQYVREVVDGTSTQLWRRSDAGHRRVRVIVVQNSPNSFNRRCQPILRFANSPIFEPGHDGIPRMTVASHNPFDSSRKTIALSSGIYGTVAVLSVKDAWTPSSVIRLRLGFDFDFNPRLCIYFDSKSMPVPPPLEGYESSDWMSLISWTSPKFDIAMGGFVAKEDRDRTDDSYWAVQGHRSKGILVLLYSLNVFINIERKELIYERFWTVDIQRISSHHQPIFTLNTSDWASLESLKSSHSLTLAFSQGDHMGPSDELCPICSSPLYTPISTGCGHTFCQNCIDWTDISVVSSDLVTVPLKYNDLPTSDSQRNDQEIICPLCGGLTTVFFDSLLQESLQARSLHIYHNSFGMGEGTVSSLLGSSTLETLTLLIGNTHKLSQFISSDLQSDPQRENKHDWTFFVRPSNKAMVEEVVVHLHKSFRNNKISLRHPPFELRRWGWGYFTIFVEVILKPGYTILHDEAVETVEGGYKNRLNLEWELSLDNDGAQGKLRVMVEKHRSAKLFAEGEMMERFLKIRDFQRAARASNADTEPHQMEIEHTLSGT